MSKIWSTTEKSLVWRYYRQVPTQALAIVLDRPESGVERVGRKFAPKSQTKRQQFYKYLLEHPGQEFTKEQLAYAVGISYSYVDYCYQKFRGTGTIAKRIVKRQRWNAIAFYRFNPSGDSR